MPTNWSYRLRECRRVNDLTQVDAAEALAKLAWVRDGRRVGINADMVSKWERGLKEPSRSYRGLIDAASREGQPAAPPVAVEAPQIELPVGRLTPEMVTFMDDLLNSYTRADNALGPAYLLRVASQHVLGLEPLLAGANGQLRRRGLRLCSRFAEFAGWLSQDAGDLVAAEHWTDRALDFVEEDDDPTLRAYILMRKSGIAADRHDHGRSVSLAIAASRQVDALSLRLRALTLRQCAISHALAHDERESERAAKQALAVEIPVAEHGEPFSYCTPSYVAMESGASAFKLGRYDLAAERLVHAAATWPEGGFARDHGLCLARLALVDAARGKVEEACLVGEDAIALTRVADSARTRGVLLSLTQRLAPYDRVALVSEFRSELATLG